VHADRIAAGFRIAIDSQQRRRTKMRWIREAPGPAMHLLQLPLFRLLAINLVIGAIIAVVMIGGLLMINPLNIRHMIFADREPAAVLAVLVFDFFITFGSAAMGTAVMALGRGPNGDASVERARMTPRRDFH
jgi:hypothetical protein